MDLTSLIQQYLDGNKHMQLATADNGQPWLCTVYFTSDENFNLYWMSARNRQHSLEIAANPNVAVTVVRDPENKQALQIVGQAHEVADDDLERVHGLYTAKFGPKEYDLEKIKQHLPDDRAYWIFTPTAISLWDEVNFPDSPKQHYQLER